MTILGREEDFSLEILFAMNLFDHSGEFVGAQSQAWYSQNTRTSCLWVTLDRYLGPNNTLYQYPCLKAILRNFSDQIVRKVFANIG